MAEVFDNATSPGTTTLLSAPLNVGDGSVFVQDHASDILQTGQFRVIDPTNGATELVMVTSGQNTARWSLTRGIEGTTPKSFPANSIIKHIWTAGAFRQTIPALDWIDVSILPGIDLSGSETSDSAIADGIAEIYSTRIADEDAGASSFYRCTKGLYIPAGARIVLERSGIAGEVMKICAKCRALQPAS